MSFRPSYFRSALIAVAGVAVLAPIARADQKIVATTAIDGPQLRTMIAQMSPDQKAAMGKYGLGVPISTTVYISGKKVRTDTSGSSVLVDPSAKTMTTLDSSSHTFSTRAYDPNQAAKSSDAKATIVDAKDTKTILGHLAHHYKLTITTTSGPMAGAPIHGDLWAARDIAQTPDIPMGGSSTFLQAQLRKIKGFPLLTIINVPNSPTGPITVTTTVKSVASTVLPASTFTIPAGYKAAPAGAGVGMRGIPGM